MFIKPIETLPDKATMRPRPDQRPQSALRNNLFLAPLVILMLCGIGCGTINNHLSPEGPKVFGGMCIDIEQIADGARNPGGPILPGWLLALVGSIDAPISIVGDLLSLPWDLSR